MYDRIIVVLYDFLSDTERRNLAHKIFYSGIDKVDQVVLGDQSYQEFYHKFQQKFIHEGGISNNDPKVLEAIFAQNLNNKVKANDSIENFTLFIIKDSQYHPNGNRNKGRVFINTYKNSVLESTQSLHSFSKDRNNL